MSELREQIEDVIREEPVALFMKGTPEAIMCGNSYRALNALHAARTSPRSCSSPAISSAGWTRRSELTAHGS